MKVVMLAAGKGSRLGSCDMPKPLTLLANGQSILANQWKHLSHFFMMDQLLIVVGYHKELIMEAFPEALYIFNNRYAEENTSKSLLKALRKIDDDVLWLNGDVVFDLSVLAAILSEERTSMVVNKGNVAEEEVKYRTDNQQKILEVSKQVVNAEGEALGINLIKQKDLKLFCQMLEKCEPHDYFEKGIEMCIQEGMGVYSVVVDRLLCTEVDFAEDLVKANELVARFS